MTNQDAVNFVKKRITASNIVVCTIDDSFDQDFYGPRYYTNVLKDISFTHQIIKKACDPRKSNGKISVIVCAVEEDPEDHRDREEEKKKTHLFRDHDEIPEEHKHQWIDKIKGIIKKDDKKLDSGK